MRLVRPVFIAAALGAALAAPLAESAEEWAKYVNRELQFTINFPGAPDERQAIYRASDGTTVPATMFAVDEGSAEYRFTVVDFSAHPAAERGATAHAAETIAAKGEAIHNRHAYVDGLSGHDLSVTTADGRRHLATVYLFDHRLYIAEGSDVLDAPPPSRFTYSLILTHPDGTQLNLDGYNAEDFNAFEGSD